LARRAADIMPAINAAHPYREGNGKTQRALLRQPAHAAEQVMPIKGTDNKQESTQADTEFAQSLTEKLNGAVRKDPDWYTRHPRETPRVRVNPRHDCHPHRYHRLSAPPPHP
jgi:hypothetical protein